MVSVVIPTYGRPQKLVDAVESVLRQTYEFFEIIVVDDNGRNTPNQIETERTINTYSDKRLIYIIHEKNKGGCAARNTGISLSNGEYVAFLDDDDVWSAEYISNMIAMFKSPDIGAVYCDYYESDGDYTWTKLRKIYYEGNVYKNILRGWCPISTSLVLVKKSVIVEAGGFDEELKSFQDYDMWLRISQKYNFVYCDKKLIIKYEGIGEQISVNPGKRLEGYNRICEKWDQLLDDSDKADFISFKSLHMVGIKYNRILYFATKNKKKYRTDILNYLKSKNDFLNRIKILKRIIIPEKINKQFTVLALQLNPKGFIVKGMPKDFS